MNPRRGFRLAAALGSAAVFALPGTWAAAGSLSATRSQQCPLPVLNADPDSVSLTGPATLSPADGRVVQYKLTAAETPGEKGDGLPHGVAISYSVSGGNVRPASGTAQGDFQTPIRFRLRAVRGSAGTARQYTVNWKASFDGGPHTCASTDPGRAPFTVVVPAAPSHRFHVVGIVTRVNSAGHVLTVDDTGGDADLTNRTVIVQLGSNPRVQVDGRSGAAAELRAGDQVDTSGIVDRTGTRRASVLDATSPPRPDAPSPAGQAACSSAYNTCPAGSTLSLTISNFTFDPPVTSVPAGTIVTVHNLDAFAHTFTGNHLDSGAISSGSTFTVDFTTPGVYRFYCSIHPFMNGALVVR